jgi:hypothetical protein
MAVIAVYATRIKWASAQKMLKKLEANTYNSERQPSKGLTFYIVYRWHLSLFLL